MKKIISISEAMRPRHADAPKLQANADATYNEDNGELHVLLTLTHHDDKSKTRPSLESQTVRMKVALDEAVVAAKDVFHSWIRKLVQNGEGLIEK